MKAAIVRGPGQNPVYGEFEEPVAAAGEERVAVSAAAVSHLAKARAAGAHYSATARFPLVPGIDGVGRRDDGRRVYFFLPRAPFGSMAEKTVVSVGKFIAVPDGLDDATAAAIANPGMSSWAAFTERAKLKAGETVLINGATGSAGRLAVQIARLFGAKKVIATGRKLEVLKALGADAIIPLVEDPAVLEESFKPHFAQGVDVVLDYVWGKSAECLLAAAAKAAPEAMPIRVVQIGSLGGANITLSSAVLRSSGIELMGSGIGSVPADRLVGAIGKLFEAAAAGRLTIAIKPVPLSSVEEVWPHDDSTRRIVFIIG